MISIAEFCEHHNACQDGRDWAMANCKTMEDVWASARPEWLVWVATRRGVLDDRTLRWFAVFCDEAPPEELDAALAASSAAWVASSAAATAAARDAATAAARDAAESEALAKQAAWLRQNAVPNFETLGGE